MSIEKSIQAINDDFKAVQVITYVDLSSKLVLADAVKKQTGQEHLNKLCLQAAAALDNPILALEPPAIEVASEVVAMRGDGVFIVLQNPTNSNGAICMLCDYDIDINNVLSQARMAMSKAGAA